MSFRENEVLALTWDQPRMEIWHGQQPVDKMGNRWRANGTLGYESDFLCSPNQLGKTWPCVGKLDGCQQQTGLVTSKNLWGVTNEGQHLYLFGKKHNLTSFVDCGQNPKVFTLCCVSLRDGQGKPHWLVDSLKKGAAKLLSSAMAGFGPICTLHQWCVGSCDGGVTICTSRPLMISLLLSF